MAGCLGRQVSPSCPTGGGGEDAQALTGSTSSIPYGCMGLPTVMRKNQPLVPRSNFRGKAYTRTAPWFRGRTLPVPGHGGEGTCPHSSPSTRYISSRDPCPRVLIRTGDPRTTYPHGTYPRGKSPTRIPNRNRVRMAIQPLPCGGLCRGEQECHYVCVLRRDTYNSVLGISICFGSFHTVLHRDRE